MSDSNNPQIFQLDEFDPGNQSNKIGQNLNSNLVTNQSDVSQIFIDPHLFPLDEFQANPTVTKQTNSKKKQTPSNRNKKINQPKKKTKSPNNGCSGCMVWICMIIGLIYFKDNIRQSKIYKEYFKPLVGKYIDGLTKLGEGNNLFKNQKAQDFEIFKKDKIIISINNGDESLFTFINFPRALSGEAILLDEQKNINDFNYYFVVKPGFIAKWYRSEVKLPNMIVKKQRRVYSDNDLKEMLRSSSNLNSKIILRDWEKRLEFHAKIKNLYVIKGVAVEYMFNNLESFEKKQTQIVYMPKYIYDLLKQKKPIDKFSFSNIPSTSVKKAGLLKNVGRNSSSK
jgi:hypothetical protein